MTRTPLTCDQVADRLADFLESDGLTATERLAVEAHLIDCDDCAALVRDLRGITAAAAELPLQTPSRDLWQGIAERIETPVVELSTRISGEHRITELPVAPIVVPTVVPKAVPSVWSPRRALIAASVLVAATAGITYSVTSRSIQQNASIGIAALPAENTETLPVTPKTPAVTVKRASAEETFDREIGSLREIVAERRGELDSNTVVTLQKNLKLIDQAIAESKAALAKDPASGFLMDRLNRAYDSKLQVLRGVATLPARGS